MHFLIVFIIAIFPSLALAGDRPDESDFEDLYDLMTEMSGGQSACAATGADGTACSITCTSGETAVCSGSDTVAADCYCYVGVGTTRTQKDTARSR